MPRRSVGENIQLEPAFRQQMGKSYVRMDLVDNLVSAIERIQLYTLKGKNKKAGKTFHTLAANAAEIRKFMELMEATATAEPSATDRSSQAVAPPRRDRRKVVPAAAAALMEQNGQAPRSAGRPRKRRDTGPSFEEHEAILHTPREALRD